MRLKRLKKGSVWPLLTLPWQKILMSKPREFAHWLRLCKLALKVLLDFTGVAVIEYPKRGSMFKL